MPSSSFLPTFSVCDTANRIELHFLKYRRILQDYKSPSQAHRNLRTRNCAAMTAPFSPSTFVSELLSVSLPKTASHSVESVLESPSHRTQNLRQNIKGAKFQYQSTPLLSRAVFSQTAALRTDEVFSSSRSGKITFAILLMSCAKSGGGSQNFSVYTQCRTAEMV